MTKHLADHRTASEGGRMKHFLRIARDRSETLWRGVFRRTTLSGTDGRRVLEYVRIERNHHE